MADTFGLLCLALLAALWRSGAPAGVMGRAQLVLGAVILQGAVGYAQYLASDPVGVVAVHVAGASVLVIAMVRLYLSLWDHQPPAPSPAAQLAVAVAVP